MDLSVIDELPPGRTPIVTRRTSEEKAAQVWGFVRKQVALGRQAYLVYPVIEGAKDDEPELDFAKDEDLGEDKKKGRKGAELFAKAKLRSTTVIEVGVDVPNASVMVIEHAERFGLAQMHQLRGRVGRGAAKSYCILMTGGNVSDSAEARLEAMVRTQNGFELAEFDLAQRGPGEFFGTRQAGMPEFHVANLVRDRGLLELAKTEAARFVEGPDPALTQTEIAGVWARLKQQWQRRYGLVEA
jgi:ATP-dependent DNA helicase RecG